MKIFKLLFKHDIMNLKHITNTTKKKHCFKFYAVKESYKIVQAVYDNISKTQKASSMKKHLYKIINIC